MTSTTSTLLAAVALTLLAAGVAWADADDAPVKPVKLPAEIQAKLGLTVQPLLAKTSAATVAGFARVLDPGPLAQLDSDIAAAEAAVEASVAEAKRSAALNADGQAVAAKQVEATRAQARADQSKLNFLRRRIGLEWGEALARMSGAQRGRLLAEIATGKAALVRLDAASGEGLKGLKSVDIDLGALGRVHAAVLGPARAADPKLLSPGLLAVARGPNAASLSVGLAVPVKLSAAGPVSGVVAPSTALLRSQGKTWVYVRTAPESFLRKEVDEGRPDPGGLFVAEGFKAGEPVVTHGAAMLFAAETNVGEGAGD
jgi:hypothetical protein